VKLDDLHIYAFGGLKDIKIDFNSGLTCINKENGWGKTTLATFIKSMFFGLKDSKSSVERNERKRFYPWGFVGKFGGKLRYTHDGKSYEVLRLFGEKISQDEFTLVDLSSGKVLSNDSTNFGEDLFGIDEEGFLINGNYYKGGVLAFNDIALFPETMIWSSRFIPSGFKILYISLVIFMSLLEGFASLLG